MQLSGEALKTHNNEMVGMNPMYDVRIKWGPKKGRNTWRQDIREKETTDVEDLLENFYVPCTVLRA